MSNNFRIITVSNRKPTEWYYVYDEFYRSVGNHQVSVLGKGKTPYLGLGDKPRLLHEAINNGLIKDKYLIFTDSWDMLFVSSPEEMIERYESFCVPIVFSCEKNCFPNDYKKEYDNLKYLSDYRYLNSGMIIGETEAIFEVLKFMDAPNIPHDYWDAERQCNFHYNDQKLYQEVYLKQPVKMALDYYQELSQTMHDIKEEELDFSGERIKNIETQSHPLSIHLNGGSKDGWARNKVLKHLNLI